MDSETKRLLQEIDIEARCMGCHKPQLYCWCEHDTGLDPEENEWHVMAFFEALDNEDYGRAAEHQERIKIVYREK